MIFFHGTSIVAMNSILKKIDPNINANTELDYGKGFYGSLEKDIKYAKRHAIKVTKDSLGRKHCLENAILVKCELDESQAKNPKYILKRDDSFIDFVFETRQNYLVEDLSFDYIKGPMADGNVDSLMSFYKRHTNNFVKKYVKWCYKLPFNKHEQIVVKSQELCDLIRIIEIRNMKGGIIYAKDKED